MNATTSSHPTSSQTEEAQQTQKTSGTSLTVKNVVEEPYLGQWQIKKELAFAPASTYSNDDIKAMIGKKLTFSKESATCFGDNIEYLNNTAVNPTYKKTVISKTDFQTNNRVTFERLGITGDSITQIDAADAEGNGSTFFIKDNNTLILSGGGVYFELTRIQVLSNSSVLEGYKAVLENNF
jgi:hypothetical protein